MKDPKFLIVVTGYNWESYVLPCLMSIEIQTYRNFAVSIVDDGSSDRSGEEIRRVLKEGVLEKEWGAVFTAPVKNTGTYYARNKAINAIFEPYDVIVLLDGDDQLLPNALEVVARQYEQGKLMTYGNWLNQDGIVCGMNLKYEDVIHRERDYRKDTFRCTHLRTFHRKLYEAIPKWDITQSEKESYPDAEILFSMMEICGKERIGVIFEPIYIYNETNPERTLKRFGKNDEGYAEICNRPKRDLLK